MLALRPRAARLPAALLQRAFSTSPATVRAARRGAVVLAWDRSADLDAGTAVEPLSDSFVRLPHEARAWRQDGRVRGVGDALELQRARRSQCCRWSR